MTISFSLFQFFTFDISIFPLLKILYYIIYIYYNIYKFNIKYSLSPQKLPLCISKTLMSKVNKWISLIFFVFRDFSSSKNFFPFIFVDSKINYYLCRVIQQLEINMPVDKQVTLPCCEAGLSVARTSSK